MSPIPSQSRRPVAEPANPEMSTADRLAQVALELFAARGYSGTSLAEIAGRLGIRKPSLYNYYRSKDELFLDLFQKSLDQWREASRPTLETEGTCAERLRRHLESAVGFAVSDPHATALCRAAVSQVSGEVAERVQELIDRHRVEYQARLRRLFVQGMEAGEIPQRSPTILVLSWQVLLDGILTRQVFLPERRSEYLENLDGLWQIFWAGVTSPPAGEAES